MGLLAPFFVGPLTACGPTKIITETQWLKVEIPAELLTCAPEPPKGNLTSQKDVGKLMNGVKSAGQDCRRKLGEVKQLYESAGPNGNHSTSP